MAFPLIMIITMLDMQSVVCCGKWDDAYISYGLISAVISQVLLWPILTVFGGRGQTLEYAVEYTHILALGFSRVHSLFFLKKANDYFGDASSLTGKAPDINCWIDAAGAESILDSFMQQGKNISRFVAVAVNNKPRQIDLLHMTYSQKNYYWFWRLFSGGCIKCYENYGKWKMESGVYYHAGISFGADF